MRSIQDLILWTQRCRVVMSVFSCNELIVGSLFEMVLLVSSLSLLGWKGWKFVSLLLLFPFLIVEVCCIFQLRSILYFEFQ